MVSSTPRPHFTSGKDSVPLVQEAGWAPGPVWTGAENLTTTGIRYTDRPTRSQSLYRMSYSAHDNMQVIAINTGDIFLNYCNLYNVIFYITQGILGIK